MRRSDHLLAGAWIEAINWLLSHDAVRKRKTPPNKLRISPVGWGDAYREAWDLLTVPVREVPVLLPPGHLAAIGAPEHRFLPSSHPWRQEMPDQWPGPPTSENPSSATWWTTTAGKERARVLAQVRDLDA